MQEKTGSEFRVGDVVRLKSGGRLMTVVELGGHMVGVVFDGGGLTALAHDDVPKAALVHDPVTTVFSQKLDRLEERVSRRHGEPTHEAFIREQLKRGLREEPTP